MWCRWWAVCSVNVTDSIPFCFYGNIDLWFAPKFYMLFDVKRKLMVFFLFCGGRRRRRKNHLAWFSNSLVYTIYFDYLDSCSLCTTHIISLSVCVLKSNKIKLKFHKIWYMDLNVRLCVSLWFLNKVVW